MKKKLQFTTIQAAFTILCFCFIQTSALFSQTISEWRSAASGDLANAGGTVWEKNVLGTWTLQAAAVKPSGSSNVTIRTGHTITLSATTSILNLTIESGAQRRQQPHRLLYALAQVLRVILRQVLPTTSS